MQEVSVDRSAANLPSLVSAASGVPRRPLASEVADRALQAARVQQDQLARRLRSVSAAAHRSAREMEGQQDWIASAMHALRPRLMRRPAVGPPPRAMSGDYATGCTMPQPRVGAVDTLVSGAR